MKKLTAILFMCLSMMMVQAHTKKPLPPIHVEGRWLVDNIEGGDIGYAVDVYSGRYGCDDGKVDRDGNPEACSGACWKWYEEYKEEKVKEGKGKKGKGETFTNPVVRADFPDPDVIRVGSTYYMVSTTMYHFPGATILKSQDLVNWEYCAQPLKQLLDDDRYNLRNGKNVYSRGMWASSMKYHNGKFYLLINGNDEQAWLLTATDPEGEWEVKRLSRNYYDPGLLFDGGKVYIVCGYNHIVMCELDEDFNFVREEEMVVRESSGLEGCHLYKIGKYYYIYATYGGWPSGQTVFRSKDIFGPYEEKKLVEKSYDGKPNTIHQGALIEDVEGKWWTIMQEDLGALGRFPNLQPVVWEKGWPVVGQKGKPYASFADRIPAPSHRKNRSTQSNQRTPSTQRTQRTQNALPTSDDFSSKELGMQWQWNHNPVPSAWSLTERPGWLRLKTVGVAEELHQAQGMLTQRIFADPAQASIATVRLDVSHLQEGDCAGICIFQDPYAMIYVQKDSTQPSLKGDGYHLVWEQNKVRKVPSLEEGRRMRCVKNLPPREEDWDGTVYLRASIKYGENKARFYYSLDGEAWESFGDETEQSFNLSVFVGSRFGIFCYATKQSGGYADFDWFRTNTNSLLNF